jgi:uncharacterized membrane-anchored protein
MKQSKLIRLVILLCIVFVVLVVFILYNTWPLLYGEKIILDTTAYDPFDPIRGQYMQIRYEINTVQKEGFSDGDKVCLLLEKDDEGISRPKEVSKNEFRDGTFICGKVISTYGTTIRIQYDIERFYFEKGASVPSQNITVEVSVSSSGKARLIQLLQNGEPINIDYRALSWRS